MNPEDIIRAWKNPAYRQTLSAEQRALLPDHPAGPIELTDAQLDDAGGSIDSDWTKSVKCWFPSLWSTNYSCCTRSSRETSTGGSSSFLRTPVRANRRSPVSTGVKEAVFGAPVEVMTEGNQLLYAARRQPGARFGSALWR